MLRVSSGPIVRIPREQRRYRGYLKKSAHTGCTFCDEKNPELGEIIESANEYFIVKNIYGYSIWDGCKVVDQLMVIPKTHVDRLSKLPQKTQAKIMQTLGSYENKGYSIYARAPANVTKSITHQHTHLIKLGTKRKSFLLYVKRPHILFFK